MRKIQTTNQNQSRVTLYPLNILLSHLPIHSPAFVGVCATYVILITQTMSYLLPSLVFILWFWFVYICNFFKICM